MVHLLGLFLALIILVLFVCILRLGWYGFESHPDLSGVTFFVGAHMVTFAVDPSGASVGCSSVVCSFNPHRRQRRVVQLLEA